jgi:Na+/phosphate symporter
MVVAIVPFVIAIIGLLLWVFASNPKLAEAGRILFFCGSLVLTFRLSGSTVSVG